MLEVEKQAWGWGLDRPLPALQVPEASESILLEGPYNRETSALFTKEDGVFQELQNTRRPDEMSIERFRCEISKASPTIK